MSLTQVLGQLILEEEGRKIKNHLTKRNMPMIHMSSDSPRKRGFAAMDSERRRSIARLGGRAAHAMGTAHEFTSEEARAAGRLGGMHSHQERSKI